MRCIYSFDSIQSLPFSSSVLHFRYPLINFYFKFLRYSMSKMYFFHVRGKLFQFLLPDLGDSLFLLYDYHSSLSLTQLFQQCLDIPPLPQFVWHYLGSIYTESTLSWAMHLACSLLWESSQKTPLDLNVPMFAHPWLSVPPPFTGYECRQSSHLCNCI